MYTIVEKEALKKELVSCLISSNEIQRIVVFGSFIRSIQPGDMDVAIFQDSAQSYLPLALKYRRQTRSLSRKIPLDIIPLRMGVRDDPFLREIEQGETVYERNPELDRLRG